MAAVTTAGCPATSFEDAGAAECPADATTTLTLAELQQKQKEATETIDESKLLPIPKPPHQHFFGLMGHLSDLDRTLPARSYWQYMNEYAPIFQLDLGMTYPRVFVGSRELVNEMADDTRFTKFTHRLHQEMRAVFGDGLFSAESTDPAWWKAHRLLVPALGPVGLSKMYNDMQDIASQLVLKWDRFGAGREIELIDDMARLTFDTIGLCAYGFRFNEFYNEKTHPLERQLKAAIVESGRRANRPDVMNQFYYYKDEEQRQQNIVEIRRLCREIIQDRIDHPRPEANDLLNVMIHGVDKVSGEKMGLENVIYQIPTLLGGGYETTSATLSFLWYFLCKNPHALRKAREEVDEIVGDGVLAYDMLRKLKYLDACMKETLRMQHPVTLFTRFSTRDTVIGGKYFIHKGQMVSGIWRHFHRDPKTWGDDADSFRPERMLDAEFSKMPPNAWKPFGDGLRACIGRGFAEQEMLICIAMVLQKFDIELVNPDYELELTGQMGVKPIDLKVRVRRRPDRDLTTGIPGGVRVGQSTPTPAQPQPAQAKVSTTGPTANLKPVAVLYGGNQGTCESLVRSFATNAPNFGLEVASIQDMDSAIGNVPTDKPTIIVTPSYEGRPADNAAQFVAWIEKMAETGTKLPRGFKFAVFGVGNSDWVHTFHRVPKLVDEKLAEIGGERIIEAGFTNVKRDTVGPWDAWTEKLSSTLAGGNISAKKALKDTVGVHVQIASGVLNLPEHVFEGGRMIVGVVMANRELAAASVSPAKRHIEIHLPPDHKYDSGDYLVVQGRNPDEIVSRVMKRFGIHAGDVMRIPSSKKSFLPTQPTVVQEFLQRNVELAVRITKRQLAVLASFAEEKSVEKSRLEKMQDDTIYQSLLDKRYSIIDILEEVPELDLPFGAFLDMLQCLMPRTYSIASSPLDPQSRSGAEEGGPVVALTVDVFDAPAINGHGQFRGVVSSFLADLPVGGQLPCLVRQPKLAFRLPSDPATPIIMLAAGSGIAPMRAFLQERAALQQQQDTQLGPALLYFGCRHPDKDYLYRSELEAWQAAGLVEVITCFSRPGNGTTGRHVPDALWADRERVWKLFQEEGARVYVCGSAARLGMSSAETWRRIWRKETGRGEMEALEWLEQMRNEQRYTSDVY